MQNKFISYDETNHLMEKIEEMGDLLTQKLLLIERDLVYMFIQIKECKRKEDALGWFECLDRIQRGLALLVYKYNLGISDRLHRFMSNFDNFEEAKEYYFEKIQSGEYNF